MVAVYGCPLDRR